MIAEPSRHEIAAVIDQLLSGAIDREEASRWAGPRHLVEAADPVVDAALDRLTLIDALQTDENLATTGYLYDFTELEALREALGVI